MKETKDKVRQASRFMGAQPRKRKPSAARLPLDDDHTAYDCLYADTATPGTLVREIVFLHSQIGRLLQRVAALEAKQG